MHEAPLPLGPCRGFSKIEIGWQWYHRGIGTMGTIGLGTMGTNDEGLFGNEGCDGEGPDMARMQARIPSTSHKSPARSGCLML
ncbi:hypothetical protein CHUAL_009627 [Chamberlinius hualienensis]